MSLNQRLIRTNDVGGGGSTTTEWIASDDLGNLFYTEDVTGLTGWTDSGQNLGQHINDAVFTGSVWIAAINGNGIWQTSDVTAKTGWSKVAGGTTEFISMSWTPEGVVVAGVGKNVLYTTDATGATGWGTYPNLAGATPINYSGVGNDGNQTFFSIRSEAVATQEWAYANDLFASSSLTYQNAGLGSNFGRSVFYDPVNGYYFITGALNTATNLRYQTSLGGSFTSVSVAGASSNGYPNMVYSGNYYALSHATDVAIYYSTTSTGTYSSQSINLNWDRSSNVLWNGTSWGSAGRYTSGDKVFGFRNSTSPAGTWVGVSKPTGFNGNRSLGVYPSKRPYYNAITNLGF